MIARYETNRCKWIICLALAAITLLVYWRVTSFEFLCYDDPDYVTGNRHVQSGVTKAGVIWAFTKVHSSNWHPLTWMSHMLDFQIFGTKPGGHHLTNVLFHTANVVLLFLVLRRMTGATWRSALVAAFFAWHPTHVESVAWVSERKDVLSTFFWLLMLAAYLCYVEGSKVPSAKSRFFYCLAVLLYVLGLMSKPMLVTSPFVLLLLDFWPLGRTPFFKAARTAISQSPSSLPAQKGIAALVWEKLPFFALTVASCWITLYAQKSSIASSDQMSLELRLGNTLVSYLEYLGKMIWPADLAVFYPHPNEVPIEQVGLAVVVLAVISIWALIQARRFPYLFMGWFLFLGTLIPVIGIIQVGQQAMADRYTYISFLGLFIAVVWGLADGSHSHKRWQWGLNLAAISAVAACLVLTSIQLGYWRNDITLFTHARDVTSRNFVAYAALAARQEVADKTEEAIAGYNLALTFKPNSTEALFGLGRALLKAGRLEEAIASYRAALQIDPRYTEIYNALGVALAKQSNFQEAEAAYRNALQLDPDYLEAHLNLGLALFNQRKVEEAIPELAGVLAVQPDSIDALLGMGNALAVSGKPDAAITHYARVLKLKPDHAEAHRKTGTTLLLQGKPDAAITHFEAALRSDATDPSTHYQLGSILSQQGRTREALQHYEAALRLNPDSLEVLNNVAWIRATSGTAEFRNGKEAVRLAERACELTQNQQAFLLGTLAAGYAEAGQFPDAVATATKARDLALAANQKELAAKNQELLQLYQAHQPYHESPIPTTTPLP
jgi:tetratricopeptide (TPR) repeat protein